MVESQEREDKVKSELAEAKRDLAKSGTTFMSIFMCVSMEETIIFIYDNLSSEYSSAVGTRIIETTRTIKSTYTPFSISSFPCLNSFLI